VSFLTDRGSVNRSGGITEGAWELRIGPENALCSIGFRLFALETLRVMALLIPPNGLGWQRAASRRLAVRRIAVL